MLNMRTIFRARLNPVVVVLLVGCGGEGLGSGGAGAGGAGTGGSFGSGGVSGTGGQTNSGGNSAAGGSAGGGGGAGAMGTDAAIDSPIDAPTDRGSDSGGTGDTFRSDGDGGGTGMDAVLTSACPACGLDELCVGYYDGVCTPMSTRCNKISPETRVAILVNHERCFMKPIGDEVCGRKDGGILFGCGEPTCGSKETLVSDINCYGP